MRKVPTLNMQTTNARALNLRKKLEEEICVQATQTDDPWLLFLTSEYVGKICFMHDIPERHKLYRVSNIAYWTSTKSRYANWEATLEPVNLLPSGEFSVPDEHTIVGPKGARLTKSKSLLGYVLAQYIDGDDAEPTRSDCVDLYIENAIDKLKAYLFKLCQLQRSQKAKGKTDCAYIYTCFIRSINLKMYCYSIQLTHFTSPQMAPKKKPPPLARSLQVIEEERVNVKRRTRERIALLFSVTETSQDKATQTEVAMREVNVEVIEWHGCLNLVCFSLWLLCINLLFFQWLYLYKV